ncbi:MAG: citramalate synthase [Dehalococcoidia bacterium]
MARQWAKVEIGEETMREGMQIEDKDIPVADKIRLLDALSKTGIKNINVGSFVSPTYTPQMAKIDEIVTGFHPEPGVRYTALALNERGVQRAREYSPPLTIGRGNPSLGVHMCDVFIRRNANRSQADEIGRWPGTVAAAKEAGAKEAGIGCNASWGSNFTGEVAMEDRFAILEREHKLWDEAGIKVTSISLGDPMGWCRPWIVKDDIIEVKKRWPDIVNWRFHFHNGRGLALSCTYAALDALEAKDTLHIDTALGGIGGCPYCGSGRGMGMAPTEDVVNMLNEMGIETGVDIYKVIECEWLLEEILGRPLVGMVSKVGPMPRGKKLYDPNLPFIETFQHAKHFLLGPTVYEGAISPWAKPIESEQLNALRAAGKA